jgi:hypothetical protein
MALQHLRSSTANKRPTPAAMSDGQLAINTEATSPGLFFKNSSGDLVKVGPVHVGTTAPNVSPAAGGQTGNTLGEQWLDTTGGTYVFKVWDGSAWRSETGTFVDVNGDTMTGALGIIAGTAGAPGLFISGDTNTGIYSPGADQLAVSTGGTGRLTVSTTAVSSTLAVDHPLGAVGTPSITFTGDLNTGLWSPTADTIAASTGGSERLRIDSSGRVGIGTSSPSTSLHVAGVARIGANDTTDALLEIGAGATGDRTAYIDLTGDTTYSDYGLRIQRDNSGANTTSRLLHRGTGDFRLITQEAASIAFWTNNTERARIDTSGRLLVGTSSSLNTKYNASSFGPDFQVAATFGASGFYRYSNNADGPSMILSKSRSGTLGTQTVVSDGDTLGHLGFTGSDGTAFQTAAAIFAQVDGTPGANDMPGRLVFSTTADGASSPTERARITSGGEVYIAGTTDQGAYNLQVNGTGVWGAGAYVNGSDERLKEDIEPLASATDVLLQLRPVTFKYKESYSRDQGIQPGFIAQELQEAMAGQVYLDGVVQQGPEYLNVAYQGLIPVLTKALQEAIAKIETLEAKVAALEAS